MRAKDQFFHKYYYDDDNRLKNVFTSKDGVIWDQDAKYFYYRHGPLSRVELGDNKVQAMDYAYTLHGWIKGVNSNKLVPANDIGGDGLPLTGNGINSFISEDVMGYSLGYYATDYNSIVSSTVSPSTYFLAGTSSSPLSTANKDMFNGNISSMTKSIKQYMNSSSGKPHAYLYQYDQLNRLVQAVGVEDYNTTTNAWNSTSTNLDYKETFSYDGNGNIQTLKRYDNAGTIMDNLTYQYTNIASGFTKNTNKLDHITDATSTSGIMDDLETQATSNYDYDNIGNLIKDVSEQIADIKWTVYGKIKEITRSTGSTKPDLLFNYDASGNRVSKIVKTKTSGGALQASNLWSYTYYLRDAQGNTMSTYEKTAANSGVLTLTGNHLYGSSRLGVLARSENMTTAFVPPTVKSRNAGNKSFELNNHLGNVLTVISDRKIAQDLNSDLVNDNFMAEILSATDYYAFGSPMPLKNTNGANYRYGFNGKENDNEVKGSGNQQDYGMRIYDPRLGRFLSVDPLSNNFPYYTPYQFAGNKPIEAIDLDGMEELSNKVINNVRFVVLKNVSFKTIIRNSQNSLTTEMKKADQKNKGDYMINGQQFEAKPGTNPDYHTATSPQPNYQSQGQNVQSGNVVEGRSSKETFYIAISKAGNVSSGQGNPPAGSENAFGGGSTCNDKRTAIW